MCYELINKHNVIATTRKNTRGKFHASAKVVHCPRLVRHRLIPQTHLRYKSGRRRLLKPVNGYNWLYSGKGKKGRARRNHNKRGTTSASEDFWVAVLTILLHISRLDPTYIEREGANAKSVPMEGRGWSCRGWSRAVLSPTSSRFPHCKTLSSSALNFARLPLRVDVTEKHDETQVWCDNNYNVLWFTY